MASFTDNPVILEPYHEQLPIQAMVQTGIQREMEFQKGIETVQSAYNELLSLPIAKTEINDYVKKKVGELNSNLSSSISGDFSDMRLTNQIGGLAAKIANDPYVQNGVKSTAAIQSGMAQAKADQDLHAKEGKIPTNNINDFNERVSQWMSDGKLDTEFQGSYTPYVDIVGETMKLYKEQNPSDNITEDAFRYDENGNITINPTLKGGISAQKIQSILNLTFQRPDVQQQLAVDGRQTFKGATPQDLFTNLHQSTTQTLNDTQAAVRKLQTTLATDASANAIATNAQINDLKNHANNVASQYQEDLKLLQTNPEAFKATMVKRGISSNFINAYTTETLKESPLFNQNIKLEEFKLNRDKFAETLKMDEFTISKETAELKLKQLKEEKAAKDAGLPYTTSPDILNQSAGELSSTTAYTKLSNLQANYNHELWNQANQIARAAGIKEPGTVNADGSITPNVGKDGNTQFQTPQEAWREVQRILTEAGKGFVNGQPSNVAKESNRTLTRIMDSITSLDDAIQKVEQKNSSSLQVIKQQFGGNQDYASAYIVESELPGWQAEQARLKSKYGENWHQALGIAKGESIPYSGGLVNVGPKRQDYLNIASKVNRKVLPTEAEAKQREEDFKNIQGIYNPQAVQLNYTKEAEELPIISQFDKIARAATVGKDANKGDAENLVEAMSTLEKGNTNKNQYYTGFDEATGKGYIELRKDGKPYRIEDIPRSTYYQVFPNLQLDNKFDKEYGDRLSTTNWRTTDPKLQGRQSAYLLDTPAQSPYSVQYHLVQGSGQGNYNVKVWIADKKAPNSPLIDGQVFAIANSDAQTTNLDRAQVLALLDKLKDPTFLKSYVNYIKPLQ